MTGNFISAMTFVIVFVVSLQALTHMRFGNASHKTLAACTALLSAIGVAQAPALRVSLGIHEADLGLHGFILLPYAALSLTFLALLIVLLVSKFFESFREDEERLGEYQRPPQVQVEQPGLEAASQERRKWRGRER